MAIQPKQHAAQRLLNETEAARALLTMYADILGDDATARADAIEGETDLREALAAAVARMVEIDALETGIAAARSNLEKRAERLDAQKKNLRTAVCVAMELAELSSYESPLGTLALKAVPAKVEVVDEAAIPARFFKPQDPRLDRLSLKAALKAGDAVPGARLDNGGLTVQLTKV